MALYKISTYSQYTVVLIGFMLCHTTSIFRQIAQIEHFSYAYFRVLFLACDGRRRGDSNKLNKRSKLPKNFQTHEIPIWLVNIISTEHDQ